MKRLQILVILLITLLTPAVADAQAPYQPVPRSNPTAAPPTPEQVQWWAQNRRHSRPIGPGIYQIDGHGIFDEQGRRLQAAPTPPNAPGTTIPPNYSQPTPGAPGPATPPYGGTIRPPYGPATPPPYGGTPQPYNNTDENLAGTLANSYRSTDDEEDGFLDMFPNPWNKKNRKSDQAGARQSFTKAEQSMRSGDYDAALDAYETAIDLWPNSPLEEDAMFMVGECYFFSDKYPAAYDAYEELLKKYKRSRHLEQVVVREFRIGQYWLDHHTKDPSWIITPNITDKTRPRLDTLGQARRAFKSVRLNDPTGDLADDSLIVTANSHFTRGDWDEAAYHYTLLVREYPDSEHQYDAHVLGVQSHLRIYQGPAYDDTPLNESERLMKQVLRQFPQLPADQRERLTRVKAQIAAARAERDFNTAEFYEKQGFADSARQYYQDIAQEFPNTPHGQRAMQRYAALHGEPGVPVERFTWISAVFPEEKDQMTQMIRTARAPSNTPPRFR